jgi:hypothetical protein
MLATMNPITAPSAIPGARCAPSADPAATAKRASRARRLATACLSGRALRPRNPHVLSTRFAGLDNLTAASKFPLPNCLIYDQYPSAESEETGTIRDIRKSALVMANMKPIFVRNFRELRKTLVQANVTCLMADEEFYDDLGPDCRRSNKAAFFFTRASDFSAKRTVGRVEVAIPLKYSIENISQVANELVGSFSHDTPRGLGFRGNWMTTYGLMSLEQGLSGVVEGVYWYGGGTIRGQCTIDSEHEVLVLEYEWSQARKPSILACSATAHLAGEEFKGGSQRERWPRRDHSADQGRLSHGHIGGKAGHAARDQQRPRQHSAFAA